MGAVNALDPAIAGRLKRDDAGLVTAVIQDAETGDVLMVGWMDDEALHRTLTEKRATFWSRSRQRHWTKGEESGNFLDVTEVRLDCDGDTVLVRANPAGPTCHTGARTCFDADRVLG
jgi:phosphoribosyl-AMP cyclohydrolase